MNAGRSLDEILEAYESQQQMKADEAAASSSAKAAALENFRAFRDAELIPFLDETKAKLESRGHQAQIVTDETVHGIDAKFVEFRIKKRGTPADDRGASAVYYLSGSKPYSYFKSFDARPEHISFGFDPSAFTIKLSRSSDEERLLEFLAKLFS